MKISCPNCSAAYELDDSRVPPAGLSIKCPKCKNAFTVHRPKADGAKPAIAKNAVPLPGQPGAKPPAARPPAAAKKVPPTVVPLPGMGGGGAAAQPPTVPADAVPLPGLDGGGMQKTAADFRPPPPGAALDPSAVPLPGLDDGARPAPAPRVGGDDAFAVDFDTPAAPKGAPKPADVDDLGLPDSMPPPNGASAHEGLKADAPKADDTNFDFVDKPLPPAGNDMLDFVDDGPKPEKKGKRPPPPVIAKTPEPAKEETLSLDEPAPAETAADSKLSDKDRKNREREERAAQEREDRKRRKAEKGPGTIGPALRSLVQPKRIALLLVLAALGTAATLGVRAKNTPAGLFWMNKYLPSKRAASAAEAKVIESGLAKLGRGDFTSTREAVASAAQLYATVPDDDEVKAFFVLAASELKIEYGQIGGDWDQARRLVEKLKPVRPSQNRALGAFALASFDVPKGKQYLATIGDAPSADLESAWLYAQALVFSNESARAAQVLDNALKARPGATKLLVLRAAVARDRGQLPEAAALYEKALQASPENARAMVELADVRLRTGDPKGASELLDKALDNERRKTLDAGEEARANVMRGRLAVATRDARAAEAAFDRAVSLDPNSGKVHEAYGEFRLQRREWDKAARQFEAAIQNGGSAAAFAGAARAYLGQNRLLEADKAITEAVNRDPNNARYLYLQGRVADAIGKAEEAYRRYEAALKAKPDLVEALAAEGVVWMSRNDRAKAQERLDQALAVKTEALTPLEDEAIGDLALAMNDPRRAQEAFARALQKDAGDAVAHAGVGKSLAAQGDLRGARKEMEIALGQLDSDASLAFEYGSLLRRLGESEAALASLRKAVKLDSKEPRYRSRLGALLVERGQFEEAEQELRQAVLMNDRYPEALFFLARALAGRKNLGEAVDVMKKAVEVEPDNAEFLYHLGLIYERGQQVQSAVEAFSKSIARNKRNADAQEHLGLNLMVENRFPEASSAFRFATELEPRRPRLWAELGDAEQQGGDLDGAIRDFQKALSQDPNLPSVWTRLGIAYKDLDCKGCRTRAVDALKRATHVDPADSVAHHELGYMYKDDGRRKEAIAEFRRYLELKPDAGDKATVQDDIYYLQEESRRAP